MARHKNMDWNLPDGYRQPDGSRTHSWESINTALLMDIRDELRELNTSLRPLRCQNFLRIPRKLDRVGLNSQKLLQLLEAAEMRYRRGGSPRIPKRAAGVAPRRSRGKP